MFMSRIKRQHMKGLRYFIKYFQKKKNCSKMILCFLNRIWISTSTRTALKLQISASQRTQVIRLPSSRFGSGNESPMIRGCYSACRRTLRTPGPRRSPNCSGSRRNETEVRLTYNIFQTYELIPITL